MSSNPELPPSLLNTIPWNNQDQAIWVASSIALRRNLARYNFPSKLPDGESDQVLQTLKKSLTELSEIDHPQFFSPRELSSTNRELIFEHFLFLRGFQEPPNHSGMVINEQGDLLALINSGNHLEIRALSLTPEWETLWNKVAQIENQLSNLQEFAFSPKFGYLTADPSKCGTGVIVQAHLHLPALIQTKQLQSALANVQSEEILFMGISGNLEEIIGDLIILENNFSIGMSEEAIFHAIQSAATKLMGGEKTMRIHLKQEQNTEIKNLISKGFGLIVHSFQLETKEALNLLSLMKLGLALEYVTGVSETKLNELLFKCRRGYFSHLFPDLKDPKEIAKKRADFLQQELKGITLSPELN